MAFLNLLEWCNHLKWELQNMFLPGWMKEYAGQQTVAGDWFVSVPPIFNKIEGLFLRTGVTLPSRFPKSYLIISSCRNMFTEHSGMIRWKSIEGGFCILFEIAKCYVCFRECSAPDLLQMSICMLDSSEVVGCTAAYSLYKERLSNEKNSGCLGYIGDNTTQLCGDCNKPL